MSPLFVLHARIDPEIAAFERRFLDDVGAVAAHRETIAPPLSQIRTSLREALYHGPALRGKGWGLLYHHVRLLVANAPATAATPALGRLVRFVEENADLEHECAESDARTGHHDACEC
jgi:hypothetical protein